MRLSRLPIPVWRVGCSETQRNGPGWRILLPCLPLFLLIESEIALFLLKDYHFLWLVMWKEGFRNSWKRLKTVRGESEKGSRRRS